MQINGVHGDFFNADLEKSFIVVYSPIPGQNKFSHGYYCTSALRD